jgi:SAM-dependent methyltransferase
VSTFEEFTDPRLVPIYDLLSAARDDLGRFLELASAIDARTVLDVGCGTGVLAVELARQGRAVVGVDPAAGMLDVARNRPGGDLVTWIQGDAGDAEPGAFDLAVLTGHVAQVIFDDAAWARTVTDVHRALRPGGRIAFESRDPAARAWEAWNPAQSRRTLPGPVELWLDGVEVEGGVVRYRIHYRLPSGQEIVSHTVLRFRSAEELALALTEAGFAVDRIGSEDGELIVIGVRLAVR